MYVALTGHRHRPPARARRDPGVTTQAQQLGLVNEVVDDDELLARARELADGPQVAMRLLKKAVYNAAALTFDQAGDDIATRRRAAVTSALRAVCVRCR